MTTWRMGFVVAAALAVAAPAVAQTDSGAVAGARKGAAAKPMTERDKQVARDMKFANFLMLVEKDYEAAAKQYGKIVRKDRKNVDAYMGLVSAHARLGQWEDAIKALKRLTRVAPRELQAWHALGEAHLKQSQHDLAAKAYEKALDIDPKYAPALKAVGDLAWTEYTKAKSEPLKKQVLDYYSRFLAHTDVRQGREAARIERIVTELRDGPVAAAFLDGKNLYATAFTARFGITRTLEQAYEKMEAVLAGKPGHPGALYYQALVHLSVKSKKHYDPAKAAEKLEAAGDYAPALTELGRLARKEDDLEGAQSTLEKAVALDPKHQVAWYELGLVHKLAGRRDEAVAAFDEAVDADPQSDVAAKSVVELSILAPQNSRVRAHFAKAGRFEADIFNTEKFKGSVEMLEKRLGGVDEMAPEQAWLDKMMRRLMEASEETSNQVFTVKVVKTKMVNAFAVPNGNLYFTRGFLHLVKETFPELPMDEHNGAIASVMGHEITHVLKEHVIRSFVFKDALDSGRMQPDTLVTVTRTHEIEADREGMKLMFLAGYDPRWAVKMFEAYAAKLGEVPRGLDHPTFDERIHYLEEYWSNEMAFAYASFNHAVARINEAGEVERTDLNQAAGLYREAIDDLKRFAVAFKHTKEALNNLAMAYAKLGLFELAKSDPNGPMTRWYTEFSVEPKLALQFVPLKAKRRTRGAPADARAAIPASLRQARSFLKKALRKDPGYSRAQLNLGVVHLASGDYEEAEKQLAALKERCREGCEVDPGRIDNLIGIAKAEKGRVEEAVAHFEESVRVQPGDVTAPPRIFNLARALDQAGKRDEAVEAYEKFLAQSPEGADYSGFVVQARTAVAKLKQ